MIKIAGRVRSGRGKAAIQIAEVKADLEVITGEAIIPGTLNIILDRPLRLNEAEARFFDRNSRMLWPAKLNDVDVWVYRWKWTALHVVEVLSSVHLRHRLGLKDGHRVTLTMRSEHLAHVGAKSGIVWAVVWIGRRDFCYTNDRYYFALYRFCQALGATQHTPARRLKNQPWRLAKAVIRRTPIVRNFLKKAVWQELKKEDFVKVSSTFGTKSTDLKTS